MGLKEWIIPQDAVFFELLSKQSQKADEAAKALVEMMDDFSSMKEKGKKIKQIEHEGDVIVHDIYYKLNETLVAPLEHEDITRLASLYDDVLDYIFATAKRIELYEIKKPTPAMKEFARIIREQVQQINKAMAGIKELKKEDMEKSCEEIHKLENDADDLLHREMANLFKTNDAIQIIKLKEIYEHLEKVTDICEDVSNVLLDIRMKYS
jgi:predicted phosphate transport protein (TIGR00153 family)